MKNLIFAILILSAFNMSYGQQKKAIQYKHEGFFARGTFGLGSTTISETVQENKIDISGFSGDMNIQIGYSVTENLQLFGVAGYNSITEPKYKINGVEATTTTSSEVSLFRIGAGVTYYFMPYNAFITFDITSGQNEIEVDNVSNKSDHGVVFNFGAGKEWWVSKDWGLGAMFYFYTGTIKDATVNRITPDIKNTGFGIAFTATYN